MNSPGWTGPQPTRTFAGLFIRISKKRKEKDHHQDTKAPRKPKATFQAVLGALVPWCLGALVVEDFF
jgi:hypothetical protein